METLMPYAEELMEMLKQATNFAMEQLPSVVQEAMAYWTLMAAVGFWILLVVWVISLTMTIWGIYKGTKADIHEEDTYYVVALVAGIVFAISGPIWFFGTLPNYVMSTTAPKLFLLTKLSGLL